MQLTGVGRAVSNPEMLELTMFGRQAFRRAHGLRDANTPPPVPTPERPPGLLALARRHRLCGLLQAGLPNAGAEIRTAAFGQAQHTSRLVREAERLFARLAPDLPGLALVKGPALAAQAWPDPGLRAFDDLDFLCRPNELPRLRIGMRAAGYLPADNPPWRLEHLWHYGWGIAFRHPDGFLVEFNHRFFPPHFPGPARVDSFAPQKLDSTGVRAPTPALHLLLCCEHAIWHGWARLAWIADIAGLLARHPDVFRQAQALAAPASFAQNALAAGSAVAEEIFGPGLCSATIPAARMDEAISLLGQPPLTDQELRRFHERFMTGTERVAYRLRRILTPGDGDFRRFPLPPALRGLYWPLRPLRGAIDGRSRR